MAIIKWTPMLDSFEEMEKFFERNFSNRQLQGFTPPIDVYENKDEVVIEVPLAGVDAKDVEVAIEGDVLTIKGQSKKESEVEDKNYYRKEISSGSFFRSVALPTRVYAEKAKAESKKGILKITVPKAAETKAKTIKIESGD